MEYGFSDLERGEITAPIQIMICSSLSTNVIESYSMLSIKRLPISSWMIPFISPQKFFHINKYETLKKLKTPFMKNILRG